MEQSTQQMMAIPADSGDVFGMGIDELKQLVKLMGTKGVSQNQISQKAGYTSGARLSQFMSKCGAENVEDFKDFMPKLRNGLSTVITERFGTVDTKARTFERIETQVYQDFASLATLCRRTPMMGAFGGPAGCGKTTAAMMYQASYPEVYIVTATELTRSSYELLRDLADQLGVDASNRRDVVEKVCKQLRGKDALVIVDEADAPENPLKVMSGLRVLYDKARVAVLYVGIEEAGRKKGGFLSRLRASRGDYRYLSRRLRKIGVASYLGVDEVQQLAEMVLGPISAPIARLMHKLTEGNVGELETLVFELALLSTDGSPLSEKAVADTAKAVLVIN